METKTKELTESEKRKLDTTKIAKKIKNQLNEEYPNCKFSVRTKRYTGGSSIKVSVMKADFKVVKDFEDISDFAVKDYIEYRNAVMDKEQLKKLQNEDYHQVSPTRKEHNPDTWNNGVFLTKEGHELIKRITEIADQYNYDNSDLMSDYYDVNFSFSIQLGKYDKPFKEVID